MDPVVVSIITVIINLALTTVFFIVGRRAVTKYEKQLEERKEIVISELRAKLDREQADFLNLLNIYKSSTDEIQKKRISAATDLWDLVLKLDELDSYLFMYDIFLDKEYKDLKNNKHIKVHLDTLPKQQIFPESFGLNDFVRKEESLRLFVSDDVWTTYFAYRFLIMRTYSRLNYAIMDNQEIPNWKDDNYLKTVLMCAIDHQDLENVYKLNIGAYKVVQTFLKEKLIIEMNRMFSGEFHIRNQKEVFERIERITIDRSMKLKDLIDKPSFQMLRRIF